MITSFISSSRQACHILYKLSIVEGFLGDVESQFGSLENITQFQEVYECVPPELLAITLKEKGIALVTRASTREEKEMKEVCLIADF